MKDKFLKFTLFLLATPAFAFAQGITFKTLTNSWVNFLNKVVALLGSLAFLFFMWGAAVFILGSGDTNKVKEGKQRMIWSLVGLFVMFSVWGLLNFIDGTLFGTASSGTSSGTSAPANVPTGLGPR